MERYPTGFVISLKRINLTSHLLSVSYIKGYITNLVLQLLDIVQFDYLTINYVNLIPKILKLVNFILGRDIQNTR